MPFSLFKQNTYIFKLVLLSAILFLQQVNAQTRPDRIQVTDVIKIKRAGNVEVNPDGKWAIFSVSGLDSVKLPKAGLAARTKLFRIDLSGNYHQKELTELSENASQAKFSEDGKQLAFVRNIKGKPQIFTWSLGNDKPVQITDYKYGASGPVWSPDGKKIAFTSSISLTDFITDPELNPTKKVPAWAESKPGVKNPNDFFNTAKPNPNGSRDEINAYLAQNETLKKAKDYSRLQFQTETSTSNEIRLTHIFIIDAIVAAQPKQLTSGAFSFSSPQFQTNNTLFVNARLNEKHPDEDSFLSIGKIDLKSGKFDVEVTSPKASYSLEAISRSGRWLIYQSSVPGTVNVPLLFVKDTKDKAAKPLQIPIDRSVGDIRFTKDEKQIYYTASSNGGSIVCNTDLRTGNIKKLTSPNQGISDMALSGDKILYTSTSPTNPSELYIADTEFKKPLAITALNSVWLASKKLSLPEKYSFVNEKGLTVEYWVMKPTDFDPEKKYPLLLEIHGGPASMWGPGEASMWHEFQYFCANGIGVVYGNPRGSSGYGQTFLAANRMDWANGPTSDVLTSVDKALALGWADAQKLFISGGSYGGYLTSWIIAHDKRFLAASAQRGVYDFKTMFGEGNVWRIIPRYFDRLPWGEDSKSLLLTQSPFTYVDQINTPLLIFAGESDGRVGVAQSDMLYKALKVQGKPVEYVRHPGASHEMVRSGDVDQRIDQMLRTYEFFSRYLPE